MRNRPRLRFYSLRTGGALTLVGETALAPRPPGLPVRVPVLVVLAGDLLQDAPHRGVPGDALVEAGRTPVDGLDQLGHPGLPEREEHTLRGPVPVERVVGGRERR